MKTKFFSIIAMMCISATALCANQKEPNKKMLETALRQYLATQGDLCVGKFDWPIDVSQHDIELSTRDAIQMPVMEKLGLVVSSSGTAMRKGEGDAEESVPVKRYALTDAGKKFYVQREMVAVTSSGKKIVHQGDFCAAKLSLDKLVRWDAPQLIGDIKETTATYTYKVSAADWTKDPEMQKVFPMIDRIIKGQGSMELKQRLRLTKKSWVAVNLWE
ncbi:MAG: hypothetical protein ACXU8A_14840 [Burkholderiaceae bacterium]